MLKSQCLKDKNDTERNLYILVGFQDAAWKGEEYINTRYYALLYIRFNENSCLVYASHIPSRFVKYQITEGIILCLPHIAASHFKIHKRLSPRKAAYCGATRVTPHEHHGVLFQRPVDCWIDSSGWEQEQNNLPSKQCITGDCVGNISATGVKLQSRLKTDFAPCCALLW